MLLSTEATVTWNSRNKKHYTDLGYTFTKMGDNFNVRVEDLTKGSTAIVKVKCDYCGSEYSIMWQTYRYINKKTKVNKDCCKECQELKSAEAISKQYGSYSGLHEATNEKRIQTNLDRYGCENPFASENIKSKIVNTNLEKYGVEYTQQSEVVRSKTRATCSERYGVENYIELFKGKFIKENSPVWKGGIEYNRAERATYEYGVWRKAVFESDKYTCQCCGDKSGNGHTVELNAHHIHNWADNEDMRYDIDNGITLCSKCHMQFHSMYGKHNNTEEQLRSFLSNNFESDKKIC